MYMNSTKDQNPPHIFAVADQSYQMMMHNKQNQVKPYHFEISPHVDSSVIGYINDDLSH